MDNSIKWILEEVEIPGELPQVPGISDEEIEKPKHYQKVAYVQLTPLSKCNGDHVYAFKNNGKRENGRVLVQCRNCPYGKIFTPGIHTLVNGHIISSNLLK